jgi:hypothetical protein
VLVGPISCIHVIAAHLLGQALLPPAMLLASATTAENLGGSRPRAGPSRSHTWGKGGDLTQAVGRHPWVGSEPIVSPQLPLGVHRTSATVQHALSATKKGAFVQW